jgi:hypothetical protein
MHVHILVFHLDTQPINQANLKKRNPDSDKLVGTFRWSEDPSTAWLVPSTTRLLETGSFRHVREKIPRKNPGIALRNVMHLLKSLFP